MKKKVNAGYLPTLKDLLTGPIGIDSSDAQEGHRQLRAAKLYDGVVLRLRLVPLDGEGDGDEWAAYRERLGNGQVRCPACEAGEYEQEDCEMCVGIGMVSREAWDEWYFAEKSCKAFAEGCEVKCRRIECPHDASRIVSSGLILALESIHAGKGNWTRRGNSLDGYRLEGLCSNTAALERFLNLVADGANVMSADEVDMGDEEEG